MKSDEWIRGMRKEDAIMELHRVQSLISSVIKIYEKRELMDVESKRSIVKINDFAMPILDNELSRELMKQRESGKEFLSDEEIDLLVKKIKTEHGGRKKNQ